MLTAIDIYYSSGVRWHSEMTSAPRDANAYSPSYHDLAAGLIRTSNIAGVFNLLWSPEPNG
jgi:hypothetical protein